jgi:thermitase
MKRVILLVLFLVLIISGCEDVRKSPKELIQFDESQLKQFPESFPQEEKDFLVQYDDTEKFLSSYILVKLKDSPMDRVGIQEYIFGLKDINSNLARVKRSDYLFDLNKNYEKKKEYDLDKWVKLELEDKSEDIFREADIWIGLPEVEYAEPIYIGDVQWIPNDPLYESQRHHQTINSEGAWDIEQGSEEIVIAIIDTGVDYTHEDLSSNMLQGYDFVNLEGTGYEDWCHEEEDCFVEDSDPMDYNGHGTHCAGISAAVGNNGIGIIGACPNCNILPVRAGWTKASGGGVVLSTDVVQSIEYAADNDANIISMSFGFSSYIQSFQDVIDYASSKNIVSVAASMNEDTSKKYYPAASEGVISVSATSLFEDNHQDIQRKASFSNYGFGWVDVAAPGISIFSTVPDYGPSYDPSGYDFKSGTSMATPLVAGLAGLILSKNQSLSQNEIEKIITQNVVNPTSVYYDLGSGVVDSYLSLQVDSVSNAIAEITSPVDGYIFDGNSSLGIYGTANNGGYFNVLVGKGFYPETFEPVGSYPMEANIVDGFLDNWDSSFDEAGRYTVRLEVWDEGQVVWDEVKVILTKGAFSLEWDTPVGRNIYDNHVLIENIDDDENSEIVLWDGDSYGNLEIIYLDEFGNKNLIYDFFGECDYWYGWRGQGIVIGDTNNDESNEILVACGCQNYYDGTCDNLDTSHVYSFSVENGLEWKTDSLGKIITGSPILADLNNDETLETIVGAIDEGNNTFIYIISSTGNILTNYSLGTSCGPYARSFFYSLDFAVGDINNDGINEIVTSCGNNIYSFYYTYLEGLVGEWSYEFEGSDVKIVSSIIGDLDKDGQLEIIAGIYDSWGDNYVLSLGGNGSLEWQSEVLERKGKINHLILSDIDEDGALEIIATERLYRGEEIYGNSRIYIFDNNGVEESNYEIPGGESIPIVLDFDNDGQLDIVSGSQAQGSNGGISLSYALNQEGEIKWMFPSEGWSSNSPSFQDINNDGKLEMILITNGWPNGHVYSFEVGDENDLSDWPMFQHDLQHTGNYHEGIYCSGGTSAGGCSSTSPPWYCTLYGESVQDCQECGCLGNQNCQEDGTCTSAPIGGECGNGELNIGEECDPPGEINALSCYDSLNQESTCFGEDINGTYQGLQWNNRCYYIKGEAEMTCNDNCQLARSDNNCERCSARDYAPNPYNLWTDDNNCKWKYQDVDVWNDASWDPAFSSRQGTKLIPVDAGEDIPSLSPELSFWEKILEFFRK